MNEDINYYDTYLGKYLPYFGLKRQRSKATWHMVAENSSWLSHLFLFWCRSSAQTTDTWLCLQIWQAGTVISRCWKMLLEVLLPHQFLNLGRKLFSASLLSFFSQLSQSLTSAHYHYFSAISLYNYAFPFFWHEPIFHINFILISYPTLLAALPWVFTLFFQWPSSHTHPIIHFCASKLLDRLLATNTHFLRYQTGTIVLSSTLFSFLHAQEVFSKFP